MLTVQEVAEYLKVDEHTVYRWIYEGKLPAVRIERGIRISEQALKEFTSKPVVSPAEA